MVARNVRSVRFSLESDATNLKSNEPTLVPFKILELGKFFRFSHLQNELLPGDFLLGKM